MPRTPGGKSVERRLRRTLRVTLSRLRIKKGDATIILATEAELRRLHGVYYKKKKKKHEIDVLSFSSGSDFPHPEVRGRFLGEIYLNKKLVADIPRLEALLIHGLLHLLGYSHEGRRDTMNMQFLEQKLTRAKLKK